MSTLISSVEMGPKGRLLGLWGSVLRINLGNSHGTLISSHEQGVKRG